MQEKTRLVVDDVRFFDFPALYCRTTDEFREMFAEKETQPHFDEVWLDNDMDEFYENDVQVLAEEIEEMAFTGDMLPIDKFVIHTGNGKAAEYMIELLSPFYEVERVNAMEHLRGYQYRTKKGK